FSRLEAGTLILRCQPLALRPFLERIVGSFAAFAERRKVQLSLEAGASATVLADPDKLDKVFFNLISNALKFTPRGGRVVVRLETAKEHVAVVVDDDGPGISEEQKAALFWRFRAGTHTSLEQEGSGLGLALAKELVELHGGKIELDSELGRGTRVSV